MLINELLDQQSRGIGVREFNTLHNACEQFIKESAKFPVYKLLPTSYSDFQRVKVRQQKRNDTVTEVFNKAFEEQFSNLRQRAVFTTPTVPTYTLQEQEPFYVFPINGYKYLYSREVKNSRDDYRQVVDTLFEQFEDNKEAFDIVTNILKFTYVRANLLEGITSESEIIFYGIPYYYAVRASSVSSYGEIFS